ncbi:MAG: DUF4011 domain-containing protein [Malacoplasma sp.]|nr:DUF4011 domain-containing protein [Malacoplasma sp.]
MNSLKSKLSNLISSTRKDSSVLARLNPTHLGFANFVTQDTLDAFFNSNVKEIELNLFVDLKRVEAELKQASSFEVFLQVLDKYQIMLSNTKKLTLKKNFELLDLKNEMIRDALNYLENIKAKLNGLQRKAKEIQKDKNTWNLYLTRYFLKGLSPYKKLVINAPILMYKVELVKKDIQLFLKKVDDNPDLNEKLIVFLQKDIEKGEKSIFDFAAFTDINQNIKQLESVTEKQIAINPQPFLNFVLESNDELTNKYPKLTIEDRVCFGIFEPSGGKLKQDLEVLIRNNLVDEIFEAVPTVSIEQIKSGDVENKHKILQIDKLDLYQRLAVNAALKENLLIYGPPGTGKSEVISNIIANVLFNQKDVLMVSEKAAALEVLNKRLKDLKIFMLLIYEIKDKNTFYESIQTLTNFIGSSWIYNQLNLDNNNQNSYEIDRNLKVIEEFNQYLLQLNDFKTTEFDGHSFYDLIQLLNQFGAKDFFDTISKSNLESKYNELIAKFDNDQNFFFVQLEQFYNFCNANNLTANDQFNTFYNQAYWIQYAFKFLNINAIDERLVVFTKSNANKLNALIGNNSQYLQVLKADPFKFYDDGKRFLNFKKDFEAMLNPQFFKDPHKTLGVIKQFLFVFNNAKSGDKKFILDNFVKSFEIIEKKSFKNLFYSKNFSEQDQHLLNRMNEIVKSMFNDYGDFNLILNNLETFNPVAVKYFFDESIFDAKYFDFINNKFLNFDFETYSLYYQFRIDLTKWNIFKKICFLKHQFETNYGTFLTLELIQEKIDLANNIVWDNVAKNLKLIVKNNILQRLVRLDNNDKNLLKKAIQVATLKKRPSIYNYLSTYASVLKYIFPIWVARPETAALFVPLKKGFFNYGIYDEASQMFLERAYPLLYRTRINIIAGDDKQLKPTNFFASKSIDDDIDYEIDDLDVEESLLDRANSTFFNKIMLQNHYRSDYQELIEFSSAYIYDHELNYASKNILNDKDYKPLEVINVNGNFVDQKNVAEANAVVELLNKYVNQFNSILVVSLNLQQTNLIKSLIEKNSELNAAVFEKYQNQEIDVINLENVQGNEADLVIMSIGFGKKGDNEKISANFGPIIQDGGRNRLNVIITRAKKKMVVVKSMYGYEIRESTNKNLLVFKNFIDYLDKAIKISRNKNNFVSDDKNNANYTIDFKNEFCAFLTNVANSFNLKLLQDYDIGNSKIDFALVNQDNFVVLLIQFEKWQQQFNFFERKKDIDNLNFLMARNYKAIKICDHEWATKKEAIMKKINQIIQYYDEFN